MTSRQICLPVFLMIFINSSSFAISSRCTQDEDQALRVSDAIYAKKHGKKGLFYRIGGERWNGSVRWYVSYEDDTIRFALKEQNGRCVIVPGSTQE